MLGRARFQSELRWPGARKGWEGSVYSSETTCLCASGAGRACSGKSGLQSAPAGLALRLASGHLGGPTAPYWLCPPRRLAARVVQAKSTI